MQEQIMDMSGELDAEFAAYASSANIDQKGESAVCNTIMTCDTLGCTFGCSGC